MLVKCALKHFCSCCLCEINLCKVLFVLIFQFEYDLLVNQFDLLVMFMLNYLVTEIACSGI
jgi:hypothetical protein